MDRRFFLATGLVTMLFNSVYQYSWNAFFPLLVKGFHASPSSVEVGFALFVISSTSFQVLGGRISDLRGPRVMGSLGVLAFSFGLILSSLTPSLPLFYATWTLGSVGEGVLYGISLNLAIKWYAERRGLASGLVSMGFGLGGALANPLIELSNNFRSSMLAIGVASLILLPLFLLSRYPSDMRGSPPGETLRETKFWLIYVS
ncbi:MAG: MFS transporter, partial [Metallosphaera sp.]